VNETFIAHPQEALWRMIPVWLGICLFFWWLQARRSYGGAGFIFAYLGLFSLLHLTGAIMHAVPMYELPNAVVSVLGFRESLYGLAAFCGGALIPVLRRVTLEKTGGSFPVLELDSKSLRWLFIYGFGFMLADRVAGDLPSVGAAIRAGKSLVLVGILLGALQSLQRGHKGRFLLWLGSLFLYPFFGLLGEGFLSYATITLAIAFSFLFVFYRPRWHVMVLGPVFIYTVMSFFVGYMREREGIREDIFMETGWETRMEKARAIFTEFEWLDLNKESHREPIDNRLNQNLFIGKTVVRMTSGELAPLSGYTVQQGLWSMVPRILWPGKPMTAGSRGIMSYLIGEQLSETTSFGLGQVLEYYANFKRIGMVLFMFAFGWALAELDLRCGLALRRGDWKQFTQYFLITTPLICPEWSAVEFFSGFAAALILVWGLNKTVFKEEKKKNLTGQKTGPPQPAPRTIGTPTADRPRRFVYGDKKTGSEASPSVP
jgi:hypothetical protein